MSIKCCVNSLEPFQLHVKKKKSFIGMRKLLQINVCNAGWSHPGWATPIRAATAAQKRGEGARLALWGEGEDVCLLFLLTRIKTTATSDVALSRKEDKLFYNKPCSYMCSRNEENQSTRKQLFNGQPAVQVQKQLTCLLLKYYVGARKFFITWKNRGLILCVNQCGNSGFVAIKD